MMGYKRGDIVTVNLNPKKGEEVGKIRPAVIVSDDDANHLLDTVILLPLSTSLVEDMQPYRKSISKRDNLLYDSDILINQIRTLSKQRIGEKIAQLTEDEYAQVVQLLCDNFV